MRIQTVSNPMGVWGYTPSTDFCLIATFKNGAHVRTVGDVVVTDKTGTVADQTTTAGDLASVGVVADLAEPGATGGTAPTSSGATYAASATDMSVQVRGIGYINIGANTVVAGDLLTSSTTAGVAVTNNAATVGTIIAVALEATAAKDANNCIRALIGKL